MPYPVAAARGRGGTQPAAAPWTPAALAPLLWYDLLADGYTFTDAGTTPAAAGDAVDQVTDRGGAANTGRQASGILRPTRRANGLEFDNLDYTGLATPAALTGDFVLYLAGVVAANHSWIPVGSVLGAGTVIWHNSNTLFVITDAAANVGVAANRTGDTLLRVRREAGTVYARWTGQAEQSLGALAGTITADAAGGRPSAAQYGDSATRYASLVLADRTPTAGELAAADAYYTALGYAP